MNYYTQFNTNLQNQNKENQSIKRKLENDSEEYINPKRIHSINENEEFNQTKDDSKPMELLKPEEEDKMMIEDELTDEDEILETPSYNYPNYYIHTNIDTDLHLGGFTGQLERGWSDMVFDRYE